jgi:GTP:adenosylcobinamide-phosphate guanylyltransferase
MTNLSPLTISGHDSIRDVMTRIDFTGRGVVLLLDGDGRLEATVTDGDIRRAILAGLRLDAPVFELIAHKVAQTGRRRPVTAPRTTTPAQRIRLMRAANVCHLPLLDEEGRVADLSTLSQLAPDATLPVQAVIMAGGFGKRLRPLTDQTPKPMLPIDGRPLMEHTIARLRQAGVRRINVTTHYLPDKITTHFGDGSDFGVELNYVSEDHPLGTAGALSLVRDVDEPLLVINGDILTNMDFAEMLEFHQQRRAELTVGVRHFELEVPYGVLQTKDGYVCGLQEKPKFEFMVNAGIYL